jgi:type I restriction enzyme S subunit
VPETMQSGIVVSDVVRIRVSPKKANVKFILYALNSQYCASQLNKETFGTTRPRVNLAEIRNLNIPLPSLPLQKEFAKLVENIEAEKVRQAESKKKLDELFQSLMQRAFTGELVA